MKILVLAKQVPDVNKISFDASTGRIIREGVPLSINSFDKKAVEESIRIKEKLGAEISVATMGPPQASDILNESLRMGADRGILITDRQFGGADTWATSKILSRFIEIEKPDIVLCGKYSLDGETSQVPPQIARFSKYSLATSVSSIEFPESGNLILERETEAGIEKIEVSMPIVISVSEKINKARKIPEGTPEMRDKITTVNAKDLAIGINGIADSLTVVSGTESVQSSRQVKFISIDEAIKIIHESEIIASKETASFEKLSLGEQRDGKTLLGIVMDSPEVSVEIASELSRIAIREGFNVSIAGNIEPGSLKGISCHNYYYIRSRRNDELTEELISLMDKIKPEFVIFPSTVNGREVSATISAARNLGLTADCIKISYEDGKLIQYKPAFGGGIVARITSKTKPEMATVRPGILMKGISEKPFNTVEIAPSKKSYVKEISFTPVSEEFKPLSGSGLVIGLGMGARSRELIGKVVNISKSLDAAVAATRPVVDMKLIPRQQQVGLTGIAISPALYVAVGISGHDNHLVGLRYAKQILAVNKDPNAPIFRSADYGVIADSAEFITALENLVVH